MFIPLRLEWGDVQGDFWLYGMESLWLCGGRVQQSSFEHNTEPVFRPPGECGACGVNPDKQRSQLLFSKFFNGDTTANHKGLCRRQDRRLPQACVPCMQDDIFSDVRVHASFGARDAVCSGVVAQGGSRQHRGVCSADTDGRTGHLRVIPDNDACAGDREDSTVPRRCRRTSTLQSARRVSPAEAGFSAVFGHGGAGGDLGACDRRPACHNELAFALLSSEVCRQGCASACPRRCAVGVASDAHCVEVQRVVPAVFRHGGFKRGGVIPVVSVCRAGQGREERSDGGHFQKNKEDCMTQVTERTLCCGCSACQSVCPQNAISMEADALGFLYPEIAQDKCVDCGLCARTCDFTLRAKNPLVQNNDARTYAVRHKDMDEVSTSQSGGATVALVDWILERNGVVYGCGYGEHFHVMHKRAATKEDANEFKGSKYVQSDMGRCFAMAAEDLKRGLWVLFTGTGCQVAGFLSFVRIKKIDESRLLTCDLICHGVPSPRLWEDYLNYVENKRLERPVVKVDFRDKTHYGWKSHKESFYTTYTTYTTYTYIFYDHVAFRHSCGVCPYASTRRLSDFTVCDFWGYEKVVPEMGADNKGLSLMFVSTEKAESIFSDISGSLNHKRVDVNDCLQHNMQRPSVISMDRERFERDYETKGFEYVMRKYGREGLPAHCARIAKMCARKLLGDRCVNAVKRLIGRGR